MAVALCVGCGECVWEDAVNALRLFTPDAVFAVKDLIKLWPSRVDYGVTLHPDRSIGYMKERRALGRNVDFEIWAHRQPAGDPVHHRTTSDWQGSTGLFAVKVALFEEQFDAAVLAGIPMVPDQRHIVRHRGWQSANMFKKGWNTHLNEIRDKTRSMSGWTKDLLGGEPSPEWLRSKGASPPDPSTLEPLLSLLSSTAKEPSSTDVQTEKRASLALNQRR